jgi:hypothetical protein
MLLIQLTIKPQRRVREEEKINEYYKDLEENRQNARNESSTFNNNCEYTLNSPIKRYRVAE